MKIIVEYFMKENIRNHRILNFICQHIIIDLPTLSKEFRISLSTVHRILKSLAPWVQVNKNQVFYTPFLSLKYTDISYEQHKNNIAYHTSTLINEGETICLAGGSTTVALMIPFIISNNQNILILTNNIYAISLFLIFREQAFHKNITLHLIGGSIQHDFFSLGGEYASNLIKNFRIDKTFISTKSANERGVFSNSLTPIYIEKLFLENSQKNYILINKEKFSKKYLFRWGEWIEFDGLITNYSTPPQQEKPFQTIICQRFPSSFFHYL
ncbi:MAG: hypothetical protein ACRCWI_01665 [Brevinema sp.]